jgi:hypothetical protein
MAVPATVRVSVPWSATVPGSGSKPGSAARFVRRAGIMPGRVAGKARVSRLRLASAAPGSSVLVLRACHNAGESPDPGASSSYAGLIMTVLRPREPTWPVSLTRDPGSSPGMCARP